MDKKFIPWYYQTWLISILFGLWVFIIPPIIGLVLLIKQYSLLSKVNDIAAEGLSLQDIREEKEAIQEELNSLINNRDAERDKINEEAHKQSAELFKFYDPLKTAGYKTQFKTLVNGYPSPRVIGITANPNTYALFLGIAAMVTFNYFLYSYKIQFLLGTVYFFVIMNMTKSRTGFIFFVIGIMVLFFMKSVRNIYSKRDAYSKKEIHGKFFRVILILFLILVVFIAFIFLGPEQLTWRLKKGLDITNDKSFMTRIVRWKQYVEIFRIRLILGIGTTKISPFVFQVDNEWLSHLKEYGLLGTGYFLYVFMYPLFVSDRLFNKDLYLAVLIGALFFMMTSVFFTIFQLIPIVMTLAALSTPLIVGLGDEER